MHSVVNTCIHFDVLKLPDTLFNYLLTYLNSYIKFNYGLYCYEYVSAVVISILRLNLNVEGNIHQDYRIG